MALKLYPEESISAIAEAIRLANGSTSTYKLSQMPSVISALSVADDSVEKNLYFQCFSYQAKYSEALSLVCSKLTKLRPFALGWQSIPSYINFPLLKEVGHRAFSRTNWTNSDIEFPNLIKIGSSAFLSVSSTTGFKNISLPKCLEIGSRAFSYCSGISTIYRPSCLKIDPYAFYSCRNLSSINISNCKSLNMYTFANCYSLSNISLPNCEYISGYTFQGCSTLSSILLPKCTTISGTYTFSGCINLSIIDLPIFSSSISVGAFRSCYNLLKLYLRGSYVCELKSPGAFSSTPISNYTTSTGGVYGSIYVPASLVDLYKSATNWTAYSSRITSL